MTPDQIIDLHGLLAYTHRRAEDAVNAANQIAARLDQTHAELQETRARLAAMEAERNMLREDAVATSGVCEGMVPD